MAKASPTQAWLWHPRLSHLNFDTINLLSKKDIVIGLPKLKYVKNQLCSSCELSKAKRSTFKTKTVLSSKGRLNLLHMDLYGPMWIESINGKKYILVIVDDYSRYTSHLNFDTINLLSKKDIVIGLPKLKYVKNQLCSSCELSKAKRSTFKTKTVLSSKGRLNLLHMDLYGPMRIESINGKKYILVIVDDYSRYTWTYFLRTKDETPEVLKDFLKMIQRNLQAQVIIVCTDRGTKFLNKTLHAYFKKEGIEHQTSTLGILMTSNNVEMDDPNITMEEYIRLEEEKARRRVFNDALTFEVALSCEPTVSPLNNNQIDFRISFDESDDEDYTVIYDKNSFSYKIISVNNLKTDSENDTDKVNMPPFPSSEPTVSYFDDFNYFKDFKKEFPAISYNDALTSKLNLSPEPTVSPQHIDEFDETSLSECDGEEQNVIYFNDQFPFNVLDIGSD
ncbi:retrovirus-related pol polyprotein from transposon TNT 1-94 [Tanacetum coccineum]